MDKYLIFRTDRIGDFIFSRMLVQSIKERKPKSQIDFVCSEYNSKYVKNFRDISNIYILDKYDLPLMFNNLLKINKIKYDNIIILDGKRRSIFFSIILKAKNKIAIVKDFRPKLILKFFFNKYFINSELNSQYYNFSSIINYLDFKVPKKIKYYQNYTFKKNNFPKFKKKYLLLHLDEKWFKGHYYKDFKYMDLRIINFYDLISTIQNKFKKPIIITSGGFKIKNLDLIIKKFFSKKSDNFYVSNKFGKNLIYLSNTNFRELETIVKKSCFVICCEGAISHVSNAFNIKTIALINKPGIRTALFWTKHMANIKLIGRTNIKNICKELSLFKK
tara:strand:+ start:6342 stop:7337 length:996 start_codon:yes stop_codon:yes gene_type:complete